MPPRKRAAPKGMSKPLPPGQILTDLRKKDWILGPLIGQGGFGYLYLASEKTSKADSVQYVIKVEPHSNGPLFVELAFYQRAAKNETISSWMKNNKLAHLGVPRYIGSGSFENSGAKYRFMVMDRFGQDVEKILLESNRKFSICTVFSLGLRIIETLEYLHEQEYVHADIKASNLLTGFGKKNENLVYLLDYGLAYRYCPSGQHVAYKEDPKRKHDGTIEYTSRDAHKGLAPSRRGDLEILAYCMLQWICGRLPWENKLDDKDYVMVEKIRFMNNINSSLKACFGQSQVPSQLEDFFKYVVKIEYIEKPDYVRVKQYFRDALKESGFSDDGKSVLFNPSSPKKKGKAARSASQPVNGEVKKKRKVAVDVLSDEEQPSPPRRSKRSASTTPVTDSPKKSPAKKAKKSPVRKNGAAVPKKRAPAIKSPPKESSQQTRRRIQRNRRAKTVDFAQSP